MFQWKFKKIDISCGWIDLEENNKINTGDTSKIAGATRSERKFGWKQYLFLNMFGKYHLSCGGNIY